MERNTGSGSASFIFPSHPRDSLECCWNECGPRVLKWCLSIGIIVLSEVIIVQWCSLAGIRRLNMFEIALFPSSVYDSFSLHLEAWLAAMFCLTWIRENICDVGAVQKAAPFPSPKWNNVGQGSVWAVDWFATIYRFGLLSLQLLV